MRASRCHAALEIITEAGLYTHNIFSHEKAQFNILRNFTLHKKHPLLNKRYGLKSGTTVDRGSVASQIVIRFVRIPHQHITLDDLFRQSQSLIIGTVYVLFTK